jgi:CheY-like chemotaxis protein
MVLVVDDHPDSRRVMVKLLTLDGHPATPVADGREALEFMSLQIPTLVLLDLRMPQIDGMDVLRAMRADDRLRAVPVVLFSADGNCRDVEAFALGATDYVTKGSLDWVQFRAKIRRLIGPGTAFAALAPPLPAEDKRVS